MEKLICKNRSYFCFDTSKKKVLFFGSNAVGKTQASLAIQDYLVKKRSNVLFFNSDIQKRMAIEESEDPNAFLLYPNAEDIKREKAAINELKSKMAFKDKAKELFGSSTGTSYSGLTDLSRSIKDNLYPSSTPDAIQTVPTEELKLYVSPVAKKVINFFKLCDEIEKDDRFSISKIEDISGAERPNVREVQERVIETKASVCPVCLSPIDDEKRSEIEKNIKQGTMSVEVQTSLLYYLSNVPSSIAFIKQIIADKLSISKIRQLLEGELLSALKKECLPDDIKSLSTHSDQLHAIESESEKFAISGLSEIEKTDIEKKVAELDRYRNSKVKVDYKDGYLSFSHMNPPFANLSESEKDFFKLIYFELLIQQKQKEGPVSIVIDDPFDSYDDAYIFSSVRFLSKMIKDCEDKIDFCLVFSHSLHVISLFNSLEQYKLGFEAVWLDRESKKDEIQQFNDLGKLLLAYRYSTSDFGLPKFLMENASGSAALLVEACLLRDHIDETLQLWKAKDTFIPDNSNLRTISPTLNSLYKDISNAIMHVHSSCLISDLEKNFYFYYCPNKTPVTRSDTSESVFKKINVLDYSSFELLDANGSRISNNYAITLLSFKVLCALKLRHLMEEKLAEYRIPVTGSLGGGVKQLNLAFPGTALSRFYEENEEMLSCFEHSTFRNVPPIFVYQLIQIQDLYSRLSSLHK